MWLASTHPLHPSLRRDALAGLAAGAGRLLAGLGRLRRSNGGPADRAYARLLEASGGKLTDALEREAERCIARGM